jgi:hypothetical protein
LYMIKNVAVTLNTLGFGVGACSVKLGTDILPPLLDNYIIVNIKYGVLYTCHLMK